MDDLDWEERQKTYEAQMQDGRFEPALGIKKKPPKGQSVSDRLNDPQSDGKPIVSADEPEKPVTQEDVNGRVRHGEIKKSRRIEDPRYMRVVIGADVAAAKNSTDRHKKRNTQGADPENPES